MATLRETVLDWLLIAWSALLELGSWLDEQSAKWSWLSWIIHSIVAVPVALTGCLFYLLLVWLGMLPVLAAGVSGSVTFWLWREFEQIAHRIMNSVDLDPWDHIADVVAPTIALLLLVWWIT